MYNILSKENVLVLERAVEWNKSALGILSNTILRPISFLRGSIKKGINKQQIDILIKQWGLEYVEAIKKVDTSETDTNNEIETETDDNKKVISDEDKTKYLYNIETYDKILTTLKNQITPVLNWHDVDKKNEDFKKLKNSIAIKSIDLNYLNTLLETNTIPNTEKYSSNVKSLNIFLSNLNKSENITDYLNIFQDMSKFKISIQVAIKNIDDLLDINEITSAFLKNEELGKEEPINVKNDDYKIGQSIKYKKNDGTESTATVDDQKDVKDGFIKIKTNNSSFVINKNKIVESLNNINEANQYKLPNNVTDLLSLEDINKLKSEPDIKEKTTKVLNYERLNTIMYEANYIINKLNTDKNKNISAELRHTWDLGIQHTNDYFQDLIDINKVKSQIKGTVDANTKKEIDSDQDQLNNYQKLGFEEVFPIGKKYDIKKLYAFDISLVGQNNKLKKVILLMSPTQDFVENITDDKYFWFKLYGAYSWDKKTNKIIRTNPFKDLTQNTKMVSSLMVDGDSVFISTKLLRPSANSTYMYIYDKNGKCFYNNNSYNIDDISKDISKYKKDKLETSLKDIANVSNIMKMKVIQRFIIDDENIKNNKYPGISINNINKDGNINNAKTNQEKLITLLT